MTAITDLEQFGAEEGRAAESTFRDVNKSITDTSDKKGLEARVGEAQAAARTAFSSAEGSLSRRQRGLGLQLSDRQKKSQGRQLSLARRINTADRSGAVRRGFRDRAEIADQAAGGFADQLFGLESAGRTQLANAEGARNIRAEQKAAQKKADKNSLIGSIVGTGLSLLALSSEKAKDKIGKTDGLLKGLRKVRVERWNYKGETRPHVGPYAEEFNDTFGVGQGHRGMINLVDGLGVALGAIKELDARMTNANQ